MLCVLFFCVLCEKYNAPSRWDKNHESRRGVPSFTKDISFSHRTHRFDRPFLRTVSISQNASGIQISQNLTAHIGYKFCVICRLLADVCVFSLFAERLLFICENLWEITLSTSLLRSKLCEKKHSQWIKTYADKLLLNLSILWVINLPTSLNYYENTWQNIASYSLNHNWDTSQNTLRNWLQISNLSPPFKKGLPLHEEGTLLHARRAYPRIKKGVFFNHEG